MGFPCVISAGSRMGGARIKSQPVPYVPEHEVVASMSSRTIVRAYREHNRIYFELDDGRKFMVKGYKGCHLSELKGE